MNEKIINFIDQHHVLTLSTAVDNKPYSANCFYIYLPEENMLVCTSDKTTKHIQDIEINNYVSGSIVLETKIVGKIQGLQFNGIMLEAKDNLLKKCKKQYLIKYPYAILKLTTMWTIKLTFAKLTDNRLGFGKKIIWEKNDNL